MTRNFRFAFRLRTNIRHLPPLAIFFALVPRPKTRSCAYRPLPGPKSHDLPHFAAISRTPLRQLPQRPDWFRLPAAPIRLAAAKPHPPQHACEQAPRQMTLRQEQPVVASMLYQPAAGLHQPLLQAGQRPRFESLRHHQPPPQVVQAVCDHAQPQPHLVRPESVATQPRHLHRLLPLFDPLLDRAPLVVEPYHRPARCLQMVMMNPRRGNNSPA